MDNDTYEKLKIFSQNIWRLLAAIFPAVTLAAQGNGVGLKLNNRMTTASAPLTATPLSTEQLEKAYQIVASALSTTTTNLKNLEEKYDVGLGAIIRAQANRHCYHWCNFRPGSKLHDGAQTN